VGNPDGLYQPLVCLQFQPPLLAFFSRRRPRQLRPQFCEPGRPEDVVPTHGSVHLGPFVLPFQQLVEFFLGDLRLAFEAQIHDVPELIGRRVRVVLVRNSAVPEHQGTRWGTTRRTLRCSGSSSGTMKGLSLPWSVISTPLWNTVPLPAVPFGCASPHVVKAVWAPGTNKRPPLSPVPADSWANPCTPEKPGQVRGFWSQWSHLDCVFHSGLFLVGRMMPQRGLSVTKSRSPFFAVALALLPYQLKHVADGLVLQ